MKEGVEHTLGDYLVQIQKNSLTGEGAKEVVKHLIMEGNEYVK
jgi:hypothetical protein